MTNFHQKIINILFSVLFFIGLFSAGKVFAATEFESIIDPDNASGTDYTSLSSWEANVQTDLIASTTLVFSHGGITGSIADTDTVTGATSGATADVVHTTSDQILLENISGTFQSGEQVYETEDTNYVTISNAGDSAIAVATCRSTGGTADTTAVTIDGWTTSEANYIKVWTDPDDEYGRHEGIWDESKYRINTLTNKSISNWEGYVRLDGLQITNTPSQNSSLIFSYGNYNDSGGEIQISNCIIKGNGGDYNQQGIQISYFGQNEVYKIWNNIIYGSGGTYNFGIASSSNSTNRSVYAFNNTVSGYTFSYFGGADIFIAKNNISHNSEYGFYGTFDSSSDYNISDISGDTTNISPSYEPGTALAVSFLDSDNDDYHLASDDTSAKNAGADLSADSNLAFSIDIDGESRPGPGASVWDIGADEAWQGVTAGSSADNFLTDGLIGHWTFDGEDMDWSNSSAEVRDISGNSNHADAVNDTKSVIGKQGQALEFDGDGDYVTLPNDLLSGQSQVTISGWFYKDSFADNFSGAWNFSSHDTSWSYLQVLRLSFSNGVRFYSATDSDDVKNHSYTVSNYENRWTHFVTTMDYSTGKQILYQDGSKKGENTDSYDNLAIESATHSLSRLGNWYIDGWSLDGKMDEVRIYNRVLSEEEVGKLYRHGASKLQVSSQPTNVLTDGLVGHWTFDGQDMDWSNSSAEVRDISGNSNHADAVNNPTPAVGKQGQALEFDGTNTGVSIDSSEALNSATGAGQARTWSLWFYSEAANVNKILIDKSSFNGNAFWAETQNGYIKGGVTLTNPVESSPGSITQNKWYFATFVYDGSNTSLYLDNSLVDGPNAQTAPDDNSNNLYIGGYSSSYTFTGLIDDVRVYNRELSETEIDKLYRIGSRKYEIGQ